MEYNRICIHKYVKMFVNVAYIYLLTIRQIEDKITIVGLGINYLEYMSWTEWMYNLSRYKVGYMMSAATASGSFALNCAYLGIPCIGDKRADTQSILFPDLAVDVFDNEKALKLTFKLKNDLDFYLEVSNKAKELYKKEFTKEKMLELLQDD